MKFRVHPVLYLIYIGLRAISWVAVHVFYRRRLVLGRENLRIEGPGIIIVNHPCTLMDVLNTAIHVPRVLFFLANYGLFKNPLSNWVLRRLYCIPIKRKEDVAEGEERNNDAAFEACFQHLEKGGVLFIAPEGTSWMNRWVRPLKTGTARIALGAEGRNEGRLGVKIVPIGLSYDAPNKFRSTVVVNCGAPVVVSDFLNLDNPGENVDLLTDLLEKLLKKQTVDACDEAGEQFVNQMETIWRNSSDWPLRVHFENLRDLARFKLDDRALVEKTAAYFSHLAENGLSDLGVAAQNTRKGLFGRVLEALILLAGLPLAALGLLFWLPACAIPGWVARKLNLYVGYDSTVKVLVGLFTFPLVLWGFYRAAFHFLQNGWQAAGVVGLFLLLGLLLEAMQQMGRRFWERWKGERLERAVLEQLQTERAAILRFQTD